MSEQSRADEVSKRRVLDWINVKKDENLEDASVAELQSRIRELEAQVAQLGSRRDLSEFSPEELESMAAQTAVSILQTVHQRESEAKRAAAQVIDAANKQGAKLIAAAERQASEMTGAAEQALAAANRQAADLISATEKQAGTLVDAANRQAAERVAAAERQASSLLSNTENQVASLKATAEAQAQQLVAEAQKSAERMRQEATANATAISRAAEQKAAGIRRDLVALISEARSAHAAVLDMQEKLRQTHDKAVRSATTAMEVLESHADSLSARGD